MAHKWQDDFDFDDLDDQPKKKVQNTKNNKKPAQDDDFFDLDDIQDKKPGTKLPTINNKKDLGNFSSTPNKDRNSRKQSKDPLTEKINNAEKNKVNYYDFENQLQQEESSKPNLKQKQTKKKANQNYDFQYQTVKNNQNLNKNKDIDKDINKDKNKKKDKQSDEQYFQQIDDIKYQEQKPKLVVDIKQKQKQNKQKASNSSQKQEEQEQQNYGDNYGDDFQQDAYGDDFQDPVVVEKKQSPKKVQKTSEKQRIVKMQRPPIKKKSAEFSRVSKPIKVSQKPVSRKQNVNRTVDESKRQNAHKNLSIDRPALKRSDSRNSARSRSVVSRGITSNASIFVPNKYMGLVQKNFPQTYDPQKQSQDKLSKINDKIRGFIKKLNDQLNDLINKNMLLMKNKKSEKVITVDDRIRVLEQQIKNNQTTISRMQNQMQKLQGRQGQLKQQQYQLMIQRGILQYKDKIKDSQKQIHKLKVSVNNQGNKLTKDDKDKKISSELNNIKTLFVNAKREEQKGNQRLQKLDQKIQDLGIKISDLEYQLKQKIDNAKQKGIQINSKDKMIKKYQDLKKKHQSLKNHNSKLQSLMKSKAEIVQHENQQVRISIRNCQAEIKNMYGSINHSHQQSVKVVQKAKQNPKVLQSIHNTLDAILKSLEESAKDDDAKSGVSRAQSHAPFQKKQASAYGNRQKSTPGNLPKRNPISNKDIFKRDNQKYQRDQKNVAAGNIVNIPVSNNQSAEVSKKPNFMRRKNNQNIEEKNQQRIWKEQQDKKKKVVEKEKQKPKEKPAQPPIQITLQDDKKKPFNLKRNRMTNNNDQPVSQHKIELPSKNQIEVMAEKSKQEASVVGPRMMKFNRKNKNQDQQQNSKNYEEKTSIIEQKIKIPQEPILKISDKNQQNNDQSKPAFAPKRFNLRNRGEKKEDSYMPSVVEKKQPQKKQEQYKPNFNFKQEQYKATQPQKKQFKVNQQTGLTKPTMLNLKLRDRKKQNQQNNDDGGYMPSMASNKNLDKKPDLNNQNNNNQFAPTRVRNNVHNPYSLPKDSSRKQIGINLFDDKQKQASKNLYIPPKNDQFKNPYAPKQSQFKLPNSGKEQIKNPYNPYAPKQENKFNSSPPKKQFNLNSNANNNINLNGNANNPYALKQQFTNPYAPKQQIKNPYAPSDNQPVRQRQGRIKKEKLTSNAPKQKFNIYQQAQDLAGINQFAPKDQPNSNKNILNFDEPVIKNKKQQTLDLNAMLGIQKNKKANDDLDDLLSGNNKVDKKKDKKRGDDFFGDMDF